MSPRTRTALATLLVCSTCNVSFGQPAVSRELTVVLGSPMTRQLRDLLAAEQVLVVARRSRTTYVIEAPATVQATDLTRWGALAGIDIRIQAPQETLEQKVERNLLNGNYQNPTAGTIQILVMFHRDVPQSDIGDVFDRLGIAAYRHAFTTWVATVDPSLSPNPIHQLAAEPTVYRIQEGPIPPRPGNASARPLVGSSDVQGPNAPDIYGISGNGVRVAIADTGIYRDHLDLVGRIYPAGGPAPHHHGTHVASIVGGSGYAHPGKLFRGHAPRAHLGNFIQFQTAFLVNRNAIDVHGSKVVNHSHTLNNLTSYGVEQNLLDTIIRGGEDDQTLTATPQVWIAGQGDLFYDQRPAPKNPSKNAILVTSVDSKSCDASATSRQCAPSADASFGPTRDFRVKPDLVAPGCHDSGPPETGITAATYPAALSPYTEQCGNSMAAPVVSATIALVIEKLGVSHQLPGFTLPSTYKAILVQTAVDQLGPQTGFASVFNEGPDSASGWGRVDARAAVDLAARRCNWIDHGTTRTDTDSALYPIDVASGEDIKVTLVWDDLPGDPCSNLECSEVPVLMNDLDLTLERGPEVIRPWTFVPQAGTGNFTVTRAEDIRNNVEMITHPSAHAGPWTVRVSWAKVLGEQSYSLAASHPLTDECNTSSRPKPPMILKRERS